MAAPIRVAHVIRIIAIIALAEGLCLFITSFSFPTVIIWVPILMKHQVIEVESWYAKARFLF